MAAPNAINPTAPAVNAGPRAAAPTASRAIAATMPTIQPIASGPAFARLMADKDNSPIPAAAINTAAPNVTNPTAPAESVGATLFATSIKPPIATAIPAITPIASGPALAN